MIKIKINGQDQMISSEKSIKDLVESLSLDGQLVAVAVNREIIPNSNWDNFFLK